MSTKPVSDPCEVLNLNNVSIANAVRRVADGTNGPHKTRVAVERVLMLANDHEEREKIMIALREMFSYGRATALRANQFIRQQRRAMFDQQEKSQ